MSVMAKIFPIIGMLFLEGCKSTPKQESLEKAQVTENNLDIEIGSNYKIGRCFKNDAGDSSIATVCLVLHTSVKTEQVAGFALVKSDRNVLYLKTARVHPHNCDSEQVSCIKEYDLNFSDENMKPNISDTRVSTINWVPFANATYSIYGETPDKKIVRSKSRRPI